MTDITEEAMETIEEAVFSVLSIHRNVGTTHDQAWRSVHFRTKDKQAKKQTLAVFKKLESEGELTSVGDKWFFTSAGYKKCVKASPMRPEWLDADAWILLSALYSCVREAKDLDSLISTADYFNHAIPTHEEMHGAINRLLAGRLLTTRRNKLIVTKRATDLFEKVKATGRRAPLSRLGRLRRLMDCPCCGVKLKAVRWRYPLDEKTYREAVKTYQDRFRSA